MGSTPRQMVICTIFYLYIVEVESVDKLGGGTENKAGLKRALLPCIVRQFTVVLEKQIYHSFFYKVKLLDSKITW